MAFTKQRFCLHFSMPLSPQDWANLDASKVRLVMLPLPFCDKNTMWDMRARNIRVVIRIPESDYYGAGDPERIRDEVIHAMTFCPVEAVIVGVEPDDQYVLSYGSPDWGQARAYEHRAAFDRVRKLLQPMIRVVSPGLKAMVRKSDGSLGRSISEDDPPAAGVRDWCMINTLPDTEGRFGWDEADGNSTHMYLYSHDGVVDDLRFMIDSKWWLTLLHKPVWIGEVGVGQARTSDVEKMTAYIQLAEILLSRDRFGKQHPLGVHSELLAPFVSNGIPAHWEPYYLLDDPAAYVMLGDWMRL